MDLVFAPSQIETWSIDRLRPYARNAKIHGTDQVAKIAASMAKFGWTVPCMVADDGELIAGHGRVLAAAMLGLKDVPVIRLSHLDEAERRAYQIADNKLTELGEWDEAMLREEIAGLLAEEFDLSLLGIADEDLDALLRDPDQAEGGAVEGEDDIPEPPVTPVSVAGDLWQLGSHRLICADSTSADVVGQLLGDVRPLLMVTDPPYGVEYDPSWRNQAGAAKTKRTGKVLNDDRADWREAWVLFPGDVAYVWHGALHASTVAESLAAAGFAIRSQIIWAKDRLVLSRGDYHWQHEPCWYAVKKTGKGHWAGDRKQTTLWQISGKDQDAATVHGTQKPVECMRRPILNNSNPGQAVFEPFMGSGTTLIAAETSWTGPVGEWSLRRMILHYAHLCKAAGGVDAFLIGSEMPGLTTIRSSASTYPAVTAFKALAADVRAILGAGPKIGYAADWSEYFGHHPADGSGDVFFHLDPLWSDANINLIGIDNYMPLSDWRDGFDHADAALAPAIYDRAYLQSNITGGEGFDWFYAIALDRTAQNRTLITDGSAAKPWVFRFKDLRAWWQNPHFNRPGGVESGTPTAWVPQSKPFCFTELGCPAIDRGTNQPNVFFDPKSSESFTPYFSRGWRDVAIQRAHLEATYLFWGVAANNPTSAIYGARMVHVPECAAWTWDARPYPFFPELTDVWTDGPNWRLGHWLTGRLGAVSLAALVRHLCLRAGMPQEFIDVSGLWGAVEGYVISALEAPRASISTLARHFGFDAVESEGRIKFLMRGRIASATVPPDSMVAPASAQGDVMELTRAQETELPQALKWQVARADEDYDAAQVEARRITVDTTRIASESFPMAIPPEEAERRCRRALMEAWVGRESAVFRLPPSRLALDPCDVILLDHDGRLTELRLVSIADSDLRSVDAVRQDRAVYDLPPGEPRPASLSTPTIFGAPDIVLMDLPQLREDQPAHRPFVAAHAKPWPGEMAVYRSAATDGFALLTTFGTRARMGVLVADFFSGPVSRLDLGNALVVDLYSGTLESVTDITLLGGANALAVDTGAGQWEIVQAGAAELIAPGRYRLTRLLRGQRGTEGTMVAMVPTGARVVVLDTTLTSLPISEADLGLPWNWRIGPASKPASDETFVATSFTPEGAGLWPFSVAHVEQPWRTARSPGDLTIRWTRRSRSLAADTWGAGDVPLAEDNETYEVDILDGATRKRTLQVATTSALYTAAQQTADWGAPLGSGQSLAIRIYQLSALIGRGAVRSVTLTF